MKKYTVDELKEIFKESPYSSGHTMQFLKWLDHLSEEKDQYGHKIIRPTIPDDTFDGLKEKIQAKAKQEDWEEELELLFCKPWGTKEVKSFISQLLKKEREKVIEEIDSWLKKDSEGTWELEGLYMRFKDYLRKLKK